MAIRRKKVYSPQNLHQFKKQAIAWAQQFSHVHLFTDNAYSYPFSGFANLLAADVAQICPIEQGNTFASLQQFHDSHKDWLMGYFTYDLKNEIEELKST